MACLFCTPLQRFARKDSRPDGIKESLRRLGVCAWRLVVAIVVLAVAGSGGTAFGIACIAWGVSVGLSLVTGYAVETNGIASIKDQLWCWWDDLRTVWGF